jgi:hypothetical protein
MLKFRGYSYLHQVLGKLMSPSTGSRNCAAPAITEFTLKNVTSAVSVTEVTASSRVLPHLASEGHLAHYDLGEKKKTH